MGHQHNFLVLLVIPKSQKVEHQGQLHAYPMRGAVRSHLPLHLEQQEVVRPVVQQDFLLLCVLGHQGGA